MYANRNNLNGKTTLSQYSGPDMINGQYSLPWTILFSVCSTMHTTTYVRICLCLATKEEDAGRRQARHRFTCNPAQLIYIDVRLCPRGCVAVVILSPGRPSHLARACIDVWRAENSCSLVYRQRRNFLKYYQYCQPDEPVIAVVRINNQQVTRTEQA